MEILAERDNPRTHVKCSNVLFKFVVCESRIELLARIHVKNIIRKFLYASLESNRQRFICI